MQRLCPTTTMSFTRIILAVPLRFQYDLDRISLVWEFRAGALACFRDDKVEQDELAEDCSLGLPCGAFFLYFDHRMHMFRAADGTMRDKVDITSVVVRASRQGDQRDTPALKFKQAATWILELEPDALADGRTTRDSPGGWR